MIKLNEQELDEAIDRAIEKFCDDCVPLYDGPHDINMSGGGLGKSITKIMEGDYEEINI